MAVLAGEGTLDAAVEEVGDVRVLLRFGHPELGASGPRQDLAEGVVDGAGGEEDGVGEVVLVAGHRDECAEGAAGAGEVGEGGVGEGGGELPGPVRAEVEEEDAVSGADAGGGGAGRSSGPGGGTALDGSCALVRAAHHDRRKELVGGAFAVAARDVGRGVFHKGSIPLDDRPVGALDARPAPVAVHGEPASRHGGDPGVAGRRGARGQFLDPPEPRSGRSVPSIGDAVDPDRDAGALGPVQEGTQVADFAMDASVRTQPDQVEAAPGPAELRGQVRQLGKGEEGPVPDRRGDPRDVLVDDPARPEVQMADLGVPHLARRQPDRLARGSEQAPGATREQPVAHGGACHGHRVALPPDLRGIRGSDAPAVADDQDGGLPAIVHGGCERGSRGLRRTGPEGFARGVRLAVTNLTPTGRRTGTWDTFGRNAWIRGVAPHHQ